MNSISRLDAAFDATPPALGDDDVDKLKSELCHVLEMMAQADKGSDSRSGPMDSTKAAQPVTAARADGSAGIPVSADLDGCSGRRDRQAHRWSEQLVPPFTTLSRGPPVGVSPLPAGGAPMPRHLLSVFDEAA